MSKSKQQPEQNPDHQDESLDHGGENVGTPSVFWWLAAGAVLLALVLMAPHAPTHGTGGGQSDVSSQGVRPGINLGAYGASGGSARDSVEGGREGQSSHILSESTQDRLVEATQSGPATGEGAVRGEKKTYRLAMPGYGYAFPQDHGAHRDFKTEWWYYTGHLEAENGRRFGYELTFFRVGSGLAQLPTSSRWALDELYLGHFALSDIESRQFKFQERLGRGAVGLAGAQDKAYSVWIRDWSVGQSVNGNHRLQARLRSGEAIDLMLKPTFAPVIHGHRGVSQKADCRGCASHYYSHPRMITTGTLTQGGEPTPVKGLSWMDHEFGSNQLTAQQVGWDWFSLQLDNGESVMLYVLRRKDGTLDPNSSGTWIDGKGRPTYLALKDFSIESTGAWKSQATGAVYPMGWKVTIPKYDTTLTVAPAFPNQELHTQVGQSTVYWEGASDVTGIRDGKTIRGEGYVEMTGYAKAFSEGI